jgi:arginase
LPSLITHEVIANGRAAASASQHTDERLPEVARIFELDRRLALRGAEARQRHQFPLVLAGNCVSCLGTTAGVRDGRDLGVVWLDAHADFDTPEDNLSGFTDVMGLSILTGSCWRALRETIPGFEAVDECKVAIAADAREIAGQIAAGAREQAEI